MKIQHCTDKSDSSFLECTKIGSWIINSICILLSMSKMNMKQPTK